MWWIPIIQAIAGNSNTQTGRAVGSALSYANKKTSQEGKKNTTEI